MKVGAKRYASLFSFHISGAFQLVHSFFFSYIFVQPNGIESYFAVGYILKKSVNLKH